MIRVGICDDDEVLAEQLKKIILSVTDAGEEKLLVSVFTSGEMMYAQLRDNRVLFDLIFLDIAMPKMNGIDVGTKIREEFNDNITQIVYISSLTQYAVRCFHIRPYDFLVKPFGRKQVANVMSGVLKTINCGQKRFTFMSGRAREFITIPYAEILYMQSDNRKIIIHTIDGKEYEFYGKMHEVYQKFSQDEFLFIHQSFIANYNHIVRMRFDSVVLTDGTELTISPSKRKEVRTTYLKLENVLER